TRVGERCEDPVWIFLEISLEFCRILALLARFPEGQFEGCRRAERWRRRRREAGRRVGDDGLNRGAVGGVQAEGTDRLGDVLDALLAKILKSEAAHLAHMVAHSARDADAAGQRQALQAGGDVDAIA